MGYGNQEVEKGDEKKKGRPSKQLRKEEEEGERTQKRATLRVVTLLRSSAAGASSRKENQRDAFHPPPLVCICICVVCWPSSNLDTFDDLKSGCQQFHFSANRNVRRLSNRRPSVDAHKMTSGGRAISVQCAAHAAPNEWNSRPLPDNKNEK
jgi:hypothetical protein